MGAGIKRHRTAIARPSLSRPVRLAQLLGLLTPERTFFDYGCGRGLDLKRLRESGYEVAGWDPAFAPGAPKVSADVVNLGYVVNVIEDENERVSALRAAWELAQHLLVVSARIEQEASRTGTEFGDGCLTSTNTFQKYYSQGELREWIDGALEVQSVVVAPGIFLVFRDEGERQEYLASRVRRRAAIQPRVSDILYQEHSELLEPLMEFFGVHGRVPEPDEVAQGAELEKVFGSLRQAFCVVRRATGREQWDSVKEACKVDLKIYLALEMFGGRARFGQLSPALQKDIRGHFGTYKRACKESDELLFSVGDAELIDDECEASPIGKKTPNGLYVHTDYIDRLSPILRVFEGCARSYYGMVEGSTLVKFNRLRPKVSYLIYPTFDKEAHPRLEGAWVISLGSYKVRYYDHEESENPPILHRKETFVGEDYPLYERFARLTRQEEKHGLFEETSRIGRVQGWQEALDACGVRIGGHRLFKVGQGRSLPSPRATG